MQISLQSLGFRGLISALPDSQSLDSLGFAFNEHFPELGAFLFSFLKEPLGAASALEGFSWVGFEVTAFG